MIVLDTHVWVWWVSGSRSLPEAVERTIEENQAAGTIHVSSISVWEVAQLTRHGRLELTMAVEDWVAACEALPFIRFVPVGNQVALRSLALPEPLHNDPADRIIVATTRILGAWLVTRDQKLRDYPHVDTLW